MKGVKRLIIVLTILGALLPGYAQNLVQNPSFEALPDWDNLWMLSTIVPSTNTAVAKEITTDAHEGSKSVELSNSVFLKWTYFYTDSVNAPISFITNQRYEVKGWIKSVEEGKAVALSIVWNDKLDALVFYNGNPDPVTNPDWFMVKDTITALADYNDGFLSLGFRADKSGSLPVGKLLLDDFSVTRLSSNLTDIVDFSIPEQIGPAVIDDLLHTVVVEVPFGTNVTALVPAIDLSLGATINPASDVAGDFTVPVVYTVTAEDGITSQDWTVTMTFAPPSTETDILSFVLAQQTGPATIDNMLHTVITEVAFGTDVEGLVPTIDLSPGATINPASGAGVDFSAPVIYTVTAEDGITAQVYIVAVMVSTISNETEIVSFKLAEQTAPATIDNLLHTISIGVPFATDLTALVPTIALSAGATINPASGDTVDFSAPGVYTVTAEDGTTTQDWSVTVVESFNTATDIVSFTFAEQAGPATLDNMLHTVSMEVPYGTDVSALVPTIGLSDSASIVPASGAVTDFSVPVVFTVTADDGITIQDWKVAVVLLPNTETDIVTFTLIDKAGPATLDNFLHTVSIEVPYGTDVSALVPTIGLSDGASIVPTKRVATDFSVPVVYSVTAEDGVTTQDWTVTVVIMPNTKADIVDFSLAQQTGPETIDNLLYVVTVEVPYATDISALVPTIRLSAGATVAPVSGVAADFSVPVVYSVTAEDGVTTQDWTVTVVIMPNTKADIVDFSLVQQTGPAIIDNNLHTVSIEVEKETDVSALVPLISVSEGAAIDPVGGVSADFSAPVIYTITAEDGIISQEWTVSVTVDPAVSVKSEYASISINVYPNPAREVVYVEVSQGGDIYLRDIMGRVVTTIHDASTKTTIPVSELERGTYFIQVIRNSSSQVSKIILE